MVIMGSQKTDTYETLGIIRYQYAVTLTVSEQLNIFRPVFK